MARVVTIEQKILQKNSEIALANREMFDKHRTLAVALTGSPGCGKTSLLEASLGLIGAKLRAGVIEGDVQTDRDAQRVGAFGVPVVQIVTNGTCHLLAHMVQDAVSRIDLQEIDLLLIENVGNLVCPAAYELGEHLRVVVLSTPEGEDKPVKYPAMFRQSDALVINKTDLLPHLSYDIEQARQFALQVNPCLRIFQTSCRTGQGISDWVEWLLGEHVQRSQNASDPRHR